MIHKAAAGRTKRRARKSRGGAASTAEGPRGKTEGAGLSQDELVERIILGRLLSALEAR